MGVWIVDRLSYAFMPFCFFGWACRLQFAFINRDTLYVAYELRERGFGSSFFSCF